ncbi:MAG: hypothetical protein ABH859_04320 [Pseudomonadota bacterium]
MKKFLIFLFVWLIFPAICAAEFKCVPGKYTGTISSRIPSDIGEDTATLVVSKINGTCYLKMNSEKSRQEWIINNDSQLIHRSLDTLSGKVIKESQAIKDGDNFEIEGTNNEYWKIYTHDPEGIATWAIALLYFGHEIRNDPTSIIGLINKYDFSLNP